MKTKVTEITFKPRKEPVLIDGTYTGKAGGYFILLETIEGHWRIKLDRGIRGLNIPATVVVKAGDVTDIKIGA